MYELISIPGSCSTGIHILLNRLAVDSTVVYREDIPDYRSLVPTNQVPALKIGDRIMEEGANIVLFLMSEHDQKIRLHPEFNQWLMFCYATLHPAYSKLFTINTMLSEGTVKEQLMRDLGDRVNRLWSVLDARLGQRVYMVGTEQSIIDYLLVVYARWGVLFPDVRFRLGSNVVRYLCRIHCLPEVQAAFVSENIEYPETIITSMR